MKVNSKVGLGTVKVHRNVVASIASAAALEIDGVKEIGRSCVYKISRLIGLKNWPDGIRVEFGKNDEIKLVAIPVTVKYGYNIPDIAEQVQENVRQAIEKMVDKTPLDVNINIQNIEKS